MFEENLSLMIVGLGYAQVVLGIPWLTWRNPWIDWVRKSITLDDKHIWNITLSTELAITAHKNEVTLPPQYEEYADIFSEQTFYILPPWRDFDHAIDLKESFIPKVAMIYPLNPQEVDTCKEFIEENL